jgi:hypothetical protein
MDFGYDDLPETKFFLPEQVQTVKVSNGSESTWQISNAYKEDFRELLVEAKNWQEFDSNITIKATLKVSFLRDGPELA